MEKRIVFIGDVFGKTGKDIIYKSIPYLREKFMPNIIIANGENIAGGFGITENLATKLFKYGVDVITLGNHAFNREDEIRAGFEKMAKLIRPANYPPDNPGRSFCTHEDEYGTKIGVMALSGRVFMSNLDCPFRTAERVLRELMQQTKLIIVDMHGEATSEKIAMGYFLDGKVTAVLGTHTHVPTADERILPNGTAFITDVGMTGPHDSVIGVKKELVLAHFLRGVQVRFAPSESGGRLQGVFITADEKTGKALTINRFDIPESEIPLRMTGDE